MAVAASQTVFRTLAVPSVNPSCFCIGSAIANLTLPENTMVEVEFFQLDEFTIINESTDMSHGTKSSKIASLYQSKEFSTVLEGNSSDAEFKQELNKLLGTRTFHMHLSIQDHNFCITTYRSDPVDIIVKEKDGEYDLFWKGGASTLNKLSDYPAYEGNRFRIICTTVDKMKKICTEILGENAIDAFESEDTSSSDLSDGDDLDEL